MQKQKHKQQAQKKPTLIEFYEQQGEELKLPFPVSPSTELALEVDSDGNLDWLLKSEAPGMWRSPGPRSLGKEQAHIHVSTAEDLLASALWNYAVALWMDDVDDNSDCPFEVPNLEEMAMLQIQTITQRARVAARILARTAARGLLAGLRAPVDEDDRRMLVA